jgi:hypothetical protein
MTYTSSRCRFAGAAFVVVAALPGVTRAGDTVSGGSCVAEMRALCPEAHTRVNALHCLEANADALSPSCAERLAAMRDRVDALRSVCAQDADALCPDADSSRAVLRCLRAHQGELSSACAETLGALPSQRQK